MLVHVAARVATGVTTETLCWSFFLPSRARTGPHVVGSKSYRTFYRLSRTSGCSQRAAVGIVEDASIRCLVASSSGKSTGNLQTEIENGEVLITSVNQSLVCLREGHNDAVLLWVVNRVVHQDLFVQL